VLKSQLVCTQKVIFDTLLDNLLLECSIGSNSNFIHPHTCVDVLINALNIVLDVGLEQSLQQLKEQLPAPQQDRAMFESWWQINHLDWMESLTTTISLYRHLQSHWHFNFKEQEVLNRYYNANKLLIDCLDRNYEMKIAVRREIETVLLLPEPEPKEKQRDKQLAIDN
jgi:hypothetical protein